MPGQCKKELSNTIYNMADSLGLTDYTKTLTYDEIVRIGLTTFRRVLPLPPLFMTRSSALSVQMEMEVYL